MPLVIVLEMFVLKLLVMLIVGPLDGAIGDVTVDSIGNVCA